MIFVLPTRLAKKCGTLASTTASDSATRHVFLPLWQYVAEQMATGALTQLGTDWGLSITGIAGPGGGSPEKPVGLVFIGVANRSEAWHIECRFGHRKSREWIRLMSRNTALDLLRRALLSEVKTV
ncbi:MAG: CinA family protein [Cyanobacteria bacterium P01_A01_bin.15]